MAPRSATSPAVPRVDAAQEQHLGPVQVADPGRHLIAIRPLDERIAKLKTERAALGGPSPPDRQEQAVSTGSDAGPLPIRGRSESCSEWRCAADAWSLPQLVPVHQPIGPTSPAGSGSSRRISRGRLLAAVGVKMRRQPGHRGHLRLGQRRQRGSRRCRPRSEVLSRRPPHGAVAGAEGPELIHCRSAVYEPRPSVALCRGPASPPGSA